MTRSKFHMDQWEDVVPILSKHGIDVFQLFCHVKFYKLREIVDYGSNLGWLFSVPPPSMIIPFYLSESATDGFVDVSRGHMGAVPGSTYGIVAFSLPVGMVTKYVSILTFQNKVEMKFQDIHDKYNTDKNKYQSKTKKHDEKQFNKKRLIKLKSINE